MMGMDPKQLNKLMNQMGIKSTELQADKVVIEKTDGTKILVEQPQVVEIDMKGQKSYQVTGKVVEQAGEKEKSDLDLVMESTGASKEDAEKALAESNGDIADAIMKLKKE